MTDVHSGKDTTSTTAPAPLRVAIVGSGIIGRHHARVVTSNPNLTLVAFVDSVESAAIAAADEVEESGSLRPAIAATLEEALDQVEIDLVAICSPSGLHVNLAAAALGAGKHVIIEKPLDTTMPRAREIADLAEKARQSGVVASVISQHRFDPASVVVAEAAHTGRFGRLTSGVASVAWYRSQDYYDSGDWRGTWALDGGGAVMNQGVHTVDLLLWTLGRPVSVTAAASLLAHDRIEVEDTAAAIVEFDNGALGVIHCTTAAYPGLSARYQIHGTHGSGIVDNDKLAYFHAAPESASMQSAGTTTGSMTADGAVDQKDDVVSAEHIVGGPVEENAFLQGHSRQYDDVVDAIRTGRQPGVTVDAAMLSLATVRALYLSATLKTAVLVDDVLAGEYDDTVVHVTGAPSAAISR